MKVLLQSAQSTIDLSNNTHNTHVTLGPWDIPTARDQNELARLFAAPSAYSIVSYDDYFAVKPAIMATLLTCVGTSMPTTGPSSNPSSNSGSRSDDFDDDDEQASQTGALSQTDDDDFDDDDEQASQTGSLSRTC